MNTTKFEQSKIKWLYIGEQMPTVTNIDLLTLEPIYINHLNKVFQTTDNKIVKLISRAKHVYGSFIERCMYEADHPTVLCSGEHGLKEDILRESYIQKLVHDNVLINGKPITPDVYGTGVFEYEDTYYGVIVMEKARGNKMIDIYKQLTTNHKIKICNQLNLFSKKVTALGYVHNDATEVNIFVDNDGNISIIDWEFALPVDLEYLYTGYRTRVDMVTRSTIRDILTGNMATYINM